MGFDLSSLLDNANKVSKFGTNSQENGGGYRYLYPSIGTLKVTFSKNSIKTMVSPSAINAPP